MCLAAHMQPSEYENLTLLELREFISAINQQRT
uniref:Uncharacterized protein n=1 Tax=Siphoviridae sp. ctEZK6 TaxID=2825397 RepID=A0A8S5UT95_9CAUD|nr:MAG TPA: hypothetical protein [Siphoviridae sp. ctEZK6]